MNVRVRVVAGRRYAASLHSYRWRSPPTLKLAHGGYFPDTRVTVPVRDELVSRGPIWFPLNYLLGESLERYHHLYGTCTALVRRQPECPTGSRRYLNLKEVAMDIASRLTQIFLPDESGRRPVHGDSPLYRDPHFEDLVLFYEYFHGETGRGVGPSHQTGWTALAVRLMEDLAKERETGDARPVSSMAGMAGNENRSEIRRG